MVLIHRRCRVRLLPVLGAAAILFLLAAVEVALAQTYEVTTEGSALREGPSRRTKILRSLSKGERVQKLGVEKGYYKVKTERDGKEGYVGPSLLSEVESTGAEAQDYHEFISELMEQEAAQEQDRPDKYPFESQFEFLRTQGLPVYGTLALLFAAVVSGTVGVYLLMKFAPALERILPGSLTGSRRNVAKTTALVAGAYAVASATAYFLDMGLHLAQLEQNTTLVSVLIIPRLVIGTPVAVLDALKTNWVVGTAVLALFFFIVRPWDAGSSSMFWESGSPEGSFLDRPPTSSGAGLSGPTRTQARPRAAEAETGGDTRIIAEDE